MTNTFQTLQADYKYFYNGQTVPAGTVFFTTNYGKVQHATPIIPQTLGYNSEMVFAPSTDRELLKLWNHATIERKYGVYASKELLKQELESRGYILSDNKHRWKKVEMV